MPPMQARAYDEAPASPNSSDTSLIVPRALLPRGRSNRHISPDRTHMQTQSLCGHPRTSDSETRLFYHTYPIIRQTHALVTTPLHRPRNVYSIPSNQPSTSSLEFEHSQVPMLTAKGRAGNLRKETLHHAFNTAVIEVVDIAARRVVDPSGIPSVK